ncbi:hypothetical protein H112_03485 [Trichophyton rubrum D6]|uniref:Uncharacterized protein n=3 Tax=Trichophyton TaxID=5550 RepID=A0A080WUI9_TRIRC|nr:uncharacterized protein TERG_12192 [Trichophyton rubrum CBS 118892]EZF23901.1 hypothetical protein H100_03488 [Trichophyton rubrum MR850]EZF43022.1 hypothetical protein H102_03483 [Trichophyton rubrum CBS 100081]EZF53622.1 hypothetical protein H103_03493 [Trichophyton rubrum CBS 288.86]EZF64290.1 hypothetical protein H104_03478 [Trichophyton rubrum CBS 289.86]EZF74828.1 hypothetical protein H105_03505 [Trichophyton soudanense CBS 452.61]EZF85585.1 hypothetical protein H110_03489 [Trichophy
MVLGVAWDPSRRLRARLQSGRVGQGAQVIEWTVLCLFSRVSLGKKHHNTGCIFLDITDVGRFFDGPCWPPDYCLACSPDVGKAPAYTTLYTLNITPGMARGFYGYVFRRLRVPRRTLC